MMPSLGWGVGVAVGVELGSAVGVAVAVAVGLGVAVGVSVGTLVSVSEGVGLGKGVGLGITVGVTVEVGCVIYSTAVGARRAKTRGLALYPSQLQVEHSSNSANSSATSPKTGGFDGSGSSIGWSNGDNIGVKVSPVPASPLKSRINAP